MDYAEHARLSDAEALVVARTEWVLSKTVKAVDEAAVRIMPHWHPDQDPRSIWLAVADSLTAAAMAQETVGGTVSGTSSEDLYVEMSKTEGGFLGALARWRAVKEQQVSEQWKDKAVMACRLTAANLSPEGICFKVVARTAHRNTVDALGSSQSPKCLWVAPASDVLKVTTSWNKKGDRLEVEGLRLPDYGTVIQVVLRAVVPLSAETRSQFDRVPIGLCVGGSLVHGVLATKKDIGS